MLVFHYNYSAILKDPTLILSVLYCEFQFFYVRQKSRYQRSIYRFLDYFEQRLIAVRLVRSEKDYSVERIVDTITRWYRFKNYKINVYSKLMERDNSLKIVELAERLNVPQYELRAYIEYKTEIKD